MALLLLGFFHPSPAALLQTHFSPPFPKPSLSRHQLPFTWAPPSTVIPTPPSSLPFHVYPSGAHKWFFSSSTINCTSSAAATVEEAEQQNPVANRTRLIAQNVPWTYTAEDVRCVFEKHGVVTDVELSTHNSTRNRGLAFIMMASEEEAVEALNKLNMQELDGRVIRVDFARSLKKKPTVPRAPMIKYNVFVGNLTWGVRSRDLRELFSAFNPNVLSVDVIFHTNPRRSAGYGFASFSTTDEAEAAVTALNGKKLMGRAIRLVLAKKETGDTKVESNESNQTDEKSDVVNGSGDTSNDDDSIKC